MKIDLITVPYGAKNVGSGKGPSCYLGVNISNALKNRTLKLRLKASSVPGPLKMNRTLL